MNISETSIKKTRREYEDQIFKIMSVTGHRTPLEAERFYVNILVQADDLNFINVADKIYDLAVNGFDVVNMSWADMKHVHCYREKIKDRLGYQDEKLRITGDGVKFISDKSNCFILYYGAEWKPAVSCIIRDMVPKYFDPVENVGIFEDLEKMVCMYLDSMDKLIEMMMGKAENVP